MRSVLLYIVGGVVAFMLLPLMLALAPAAYAYRVSHEAGWGEQGAIGAAVITMAYATAVVFTVKSAYGLVFALIVVPLLIGRLVRGASNRR